MSSPALVRTPPCRTQWKDIPNGMRALWKACLSDQEGGDVARSLTINVVGVAAAADHDALREVVDRLQRRTPCRAFLLLVDDAEQSGVAELAATTRGQGSMRDIVLEEITIRLPAAGFAQMPGLIRPLLMNDLPNHLFWATRWPKDEAAFDGLARLCDHTVVDSRRFVEVARELAEVAARRTRGQRITDLSWLRLRPWRRALAEAFERVPWTKGTKTTGLVWHGRGAVAPAHLLAEWLRARLGAAIDLDPAGDPTALCPDSVVLRTGGFEVELVTKHPQIRVHVTTPEHCYVPFAVPMSRGSDGDLLGAAIDLG